MAEGGALPELKQILGAMVFGAGRPLSVHEMRRCLVEVAEADRGEAASFAGAKDADIIAALEALNVDLVSRCAGFSLAELAGGYRFRTDAACGRWLKHLLDIGKPRRLSPPALESLAVVAFRQPVPKSEIEAVRGVNVDHILRGLLEMRLIRIVGRSDLPGRPFLYGTTHLFLEHFGLKNLDELGHMDPSLLADRARRREEQQGAQREDAEGPGEPVGSEPADLRAGQTD